MPEFLEVPLKALANLNDIRTHDAAVDDLKELMNSDTTLRVIGEKALLGIESSMESPVPWLQMGYHSLRKGDVEESLAHFRKASSLISDTAMYNGLIKYFESISLDILPISKNARLIHNELINNRSLVLCRSKQKSMYELREQGRLEEAYLMGQQAIDECGMVLGKENQEVVDMKEVLGIWLITDGNTEKGMRAMAEALEARRDLNGNSWEFVHAIDRLVTLYEGKNRVDDAISLQKEALDVSRRLLKGDNNEFVTRINNHAVYLNSQGRFSEAETLFKEALEMIRRLSKSDSNDLAVSIANMADCLERLGRASEAEPLFKESLEMSRRLNNTDNLDLARNISHMASFLLSQGFTLEANPLFDEALQMYRRLYKNDNPNLAMGINNMALFLSSQGRAAEAVPLFNEALEMNRRLYNGDHPFVANSMNNLAVAINSIGHTSEAEPLLLAALEMRRRLFGDIHPDVANSLNNMARFYDEQGRTMEAINTFSEAYEIYQKIFKGDHPDAAVCLNNIAILQEGLGLITEADSTAARALRIRRRLFKGDHPDVAMSMNNLSNIRYWQGRLSEAESLCTAALEMNRRLYKGDHPSIASSISNLAAIAKDQGNMQKIEALLKEALNMRRRLFMDYHMDVALSLRSLSEYYEERGLLEEAKRNYIEAIQTVQRHAKINLPGLSEKEKEELVNRKYFYFVDLYSFQIRNNALSICNAIYDNRLELKGILLHESVKARRYLYNKDDSTLVLTFHSWLSLKERIAKGYSLTVDERTKSGIDLNALMQSANDLEKELSRKSHFFTSRYEQKEVKWQEVREKLEVGEAAIEIIRFPYYDKRRWTDTVCYMALIVKQDTKENPEMVIFMNGKEMDSLYLEDYRSALKNKEMDKESYERYWGPIAEKLHGVKKVYLSSDGVYNLINVQTLIQPDGKYVLEAMDVQLVSNTKDIIRKKENKKHEYPRNAALFGYPNYELDESAQIQLAESYDNRYRDIPLNPNDTLDRASCSPLPGTEKEVLEIGMTLKQAGWNVRAYMQNDAIEEAVKAIRNPGVLHIATHGFFLEDKQLERRQNFERLMGFEKQMFVANPLLRSGLLLAGAKRSLGKNPRVSTQADNGILTAYEATSLVLDSTELVVLSACETGLGVVLNGEGVYGLQRSFLTAGARSVIMSLWRVSDDATQQLMRTFYSLWLKLKDKRKAFTQAQQELKKQFPEPFYWGAFVMVGE